MKKIITTILIISLPLFAQDITNKLGGSTENETYDIYNSNDSLLFRIQGDGGVLIKAMVGSHPIGHTPSSIYMPGIIPIEGAGSRFMWYPSKAAFRVGEVDGTHWNDVNIGDYSTAIGKNSIASGSYATAIGEATTASGYGSTAIGYAAQANGRGAFAFGVGVTANKDYSTAMGNRVNNSYEGSFVIGDNSTIITLDATQNNQMTMRFDGGYRLYTNSDANLGVGLISGDTSWNTLSDSTKKENFQIADGEYFLNSIKELKLGSWNFKAQDSTIRHYGAMAQEVYKYFGKDNFGTIGNDTTLATADMDGIMMIALQALEKRTTELTKENELLRQRLEIIENKL